MTHPLDGFSPEDAEKLRAAQAEFDRQRRTPEGGASPLPRPGRKAKPQELAPTFSAALEGGVRGLTRIPPPPADYPCQAPFEPCAERVRRPGDFCQACGGKMAVVDRRDLLSLPIGSIPVHFAWATMNNPLLRKRVRGGPRAIRQMAQAIAERRNVTISGSMGDGKTSLACAGFRSILESAVAGDARAERFASNALFVSAKDLTPDAMTTGTEAARLLRRAKAARLLVLDDLGAELSGAGAKTGLAAMRSPPASSLMFDRHGDDKWTIVTLSADLRDENLFADIYGGVSRRIFAEDCAKVIDLDRFEQEGDRKP